MAGVSRGVELGVHINRLCAEGPKDRVLTSAAALEDTDSQERC
jgi:hypothetical protein